jgi:hypothetical protein
MGERRNAMSGTPTFCLVGPEFDSQLEVWHYSEYLEMQEKITNIMVLAEIRKVYLSKKKQ